MAVNGETWAKVMKPSGVKPEQAPNRRWSAATATDKVKRPRSNTFEQSSRMREDYP